MLPFFGAALGLCFSPLQAHARANDQGYQLNLDAVHAAADAPFKTERPVLDDAEATLNPDQPLEFDEVEDDMGGGSARIDVLPYGADTKDPAPTKLLEHNPRLLDLPGHPNLESIQNLLITKDGKNPEEAAQIANEVLSLFTQMLYHGRQYEERVVKLQNDYQERDSQGLLEKKDREPPNFEYYLNRGQITYPPKDVIAPGRAKVTLNDDHKWIKVIHKKSHLAFLFFNADKIDVQSPTTQKIIANIHFNGGKNIKPEEYTDPEMKRRRTKLAVYGRDEAVILYSEDAADPDEEPTVHRVYAVDRPVEGTPQYKKEYTTACDKAIDWGNMIANGLGSGFVQAGTMVLIDKIAPYLGRFGAAEKGINYWMLSATVLYSCYAGGWMAPKLRMKTNRWTTTQRFWYRALLVSIPFAVGYKFFVEGQHAEAAAAAGISALALFIFRQIADVYLSVSINTRLSHSLGEHTDLDEELRDYEGLSLWPHHSMGRLTVQTKRVDRVSQRRYLAVRFPMQVAFLKEGWKNLTEIPLVNYPISAAKIANVLVASIVHWTVVHRSEARSSAKADGRRALWEYGIDGAAVRFFIEGAKGMVEVGKAAKKALVLNSLGKEVSDTQLASQLETWSQQLEATSQTTAPRSRAFRWTAKKSAQIFDRIAYRLRNGKSKPVADEDRWRMPQVKLPNFSALLKKPALPENRIDGAAVRFAVEGAKGVAAVGKAVKKAIDLNSIGKDVPEELVAQKLADWAKQLQLNSETAEPRSQAFRWTARKCGQALGLLSGLSRDVNEPVAVAAVNR